MLDSKETIANYKSHSLNLHSAILTQIFICCCGGYDQRVYGHGRVWIPWTLGPLDPWPIDS